MLLLWPFAFFYPFPADHVSAAGLAGVAYICLFPSVLSFLFWNISVQKVGPSHAGVYLNLIAVFTAIITFLFGGALSIPQLAGGAVVLFGVYLATKMPKAKAEQVDIAG
ncbi:EamA family transporter [Geobacillus kaustophilus]|uniref:EamA family transporter n=1 Tax=Geobacillus kaustophilus TaxID=1462 RepID=UPI001E4ACB15|nr:EamA family transporter [Geobacillus kaustophilus]